MAKHEGLIYCSLGCTNCAIRMGSGIITNNVNSYTSMCDMPLIHKHVFMYTADCQKVTVLVYIILNWCIIILNCHAMFSTLSCYYVYRMQSKPLTFPHFWSSLFVTILMTWQTHHIFKCMAKGISASARVISASGEFWSSCMTFWPPRTVTP